MQNNTAENIRNMPTIFIFDCNSHFNRIYHTSLDNNGEPTTPTSKGSDGRYNFCIRRVKSLIQREMAFVRSLGFDNTHIVMVLDDPDENFRHEIFPDYKANRPDKPIQYTEQVEVLYEELISDGFPCLRIKGFEADDVIQTLGKKLSFKGVNVIVFSGDKDLMNMINVNTWLFNGKTNTLFDETAVLDKYGVKPSAMFDYLACVGDTADNVPGVRGVGGPTAAAILKNNTLQDYLDDPKILLGKKIKGAKSIMNNIINDREQILLSMELVKLKDDVPLKINFRDMVVK